MNRIYKMIEECEMALLRTAKGSIEERLLNEKIARLYLQMETAEPMGVSS
jgi:hypothetical protein